MNLAAETPRGSYVIVGDRRRRMRFPLHASCRLWCLSEDGSLIFAAGSTMNLSLDGICVAGQHVPRLNTLITVEVDLPKIAGPEPDTGLDLKEKDVLPLYGEGRVLWIDKAQGVFGALMWFRHLDPARDND